MFTVRRTLSILLPNAQAYSTKTRKKIIENQHLFPNKLLNKKHKTPTNMYIITEATANRIDKAIDPFLQESKCDTAMEISPGIGLFTKKLLDREEQFRKIILMESMEYFMPQLSEMHSLYPDRVKVHQADFLNFWKLVYQDKMDNGTRIEDLLQYVPRRPFEKEPNMLIFGAVGSYYFFKSLINSLVFQNSLFDYGRSELYLVVPPPIYVHLTCNNEIGYMIYRSTSILFQIMFEHRFIMQVPRQDFLPFQSEYNITKNSKLGRVNSINPDNMYLVKIVPRRNLFDLCDPMDLPALWYFIKQNCISRRNRVIPSMEKWAPGCGPRLIIHPTDNEEVYQLFPDEDLKLLPQYSKPCTTMSCKNYYPNMNIFTEFGDLSVSQLLTLFTQFRSWPEYKHSSFLASLENALLKMETAIDDSVDSIVEEDDVSLDDSVMDDLSLDLEEETTVAPKQKRKR